MERGRCLQITHVTSPPVKPNRESSHEDHRRFFLDFLIVIVRRVEICVVLDYFKKTRVWQWETEEQGLKILCHCWFGLLHVCMTNRAMCILWTETERTWRFRALIIYYHRLTMELDHQSLFGLRVHNCPHWLRLRNSPPPPAFGLINEGAIGQPRKRTSLCITPLAMATAQAELLILLCLHIQKNDRFYWDLCLKLIFFSQLV